ncbi:hypothetical protein [Kangiella sp. TOML190]|uniref:hypothetical protein n=1 Tax=Kangiella sp. TOML190 TaxID=2931351 RepID=UPI00203F91C7|nr:hypothetical protein [Kangiella sp. TOML190]
MKQKHLMGKQDNQDDGRRAKDPLTKTAEKVAVGLNADGQKEPQDKQIVVTVQGKEQEPIVLTLAEILYRFKGEFLSKSFSRVGKHFSGVFHIALKQMYVQPFIACIKSLESDYCHYQVHHIIQPQADGQSQRLRFDFEIWGRQQSQFQLKMLQLLNQNRLVIESLKQQTQRDAKGREQFTAQVSVCSEFAVDAQEIEQQLQNLAEPCDVNVMLLNDELNDSLLSLDLQQAI